MSKVNIFMNKHYNVSMIKNRLSVLMGEKRLKNSELAKITGLDVRTIRKIYNDECKFIDLSTLNKLCWALECTPNDILRYISEE